MTPPRWTARFVCAIATASMAACGAPVRDEVAAVAGSAIEDGAYRSPIDLCVTSNGRFAYVVNHTADQIAVIDVPARAVIGEISVGRGPTAAVLSRDERRLYVTSQYDGTVDVVDLTTRDVVRRIPAGGFEPYGLTLSSDGTRLYVANGLSDTVSIIDVASAEIVHVVPVERNPRFIAEVPGSAHVVVSSGLSRTVSIVDTASGAVAERRDLDRANLMRRVVVSHDGRWAFVTHVLSREELVPVQMERGFIHANGFTVLDLSRPGHRVTLLLDTLLDGAANPWGLTLSADGRWLYASIAGTHEVALIDLEPLLRIVADAASDDILRLSRDTEILETHGVVRRVDAGGLGPRGLVAVAATGELLVANYFSDAVSVLDAGTGEVTATIDLGGPVEMTLERKGELLFNDARICFQRWFSCTSCHQEDATVDGLNWDLPNDGVGNPKNAKSLHDAHDTPPSMWSGVRLDMDAAVAAGQRFQGFLPDPENHRALMAFFGSPRRAPNPYRELDREAQQRGERIFLESRCQACHPPPTYSDRRLHDVGLSGPLDLRTRFDTPSLRDTYRTGPFLHDGRAATLREIFTDHNPDDRHGRTSHLSPEELDDLLAYVRAL